MDDLRVLRIHDNCANTQAARVVLVAGRKTVIRVVPVLVLDSVLGGIGENHAPRAATVVTAPQGGIAGVDHLGIARIESESFDDCAQVKQAPGLAAIEGNVARSEER